MQTPRRALGVGMVALAALMFVSNAGLSRITMRAGVDAALLTTIRVTMTFVALVVVALVWRRDVLRLPEPRVMALLALQGIFGVAGLQWLYFVAIDHLPVGLAVLLEYQSPILVALWAFLVQRQRAGARLWVGLVLAVSGLVLVVDLRSGLSFDTIGLLAGLGAAVCFSTYFLIGEALVGRVPAFQVILGSSFVGAAVLNLAMPITRLTTPLGEQVSLMGRLAGFSLPLWSVLVWIVIVGTLVPYLIALTALNHVNATTVATVAMLEPIGVVVLGWVWFYESMGVLGTVGCVMVLIGIGIAQLVRAEGTTTADQEPIIVDG